MFQTRFQPCQYPKPTIYKNQFYPFLHQKIHPFSALLTPLITYNYRKIFSKKVGDPKFSQKNFFKKSNFLKKRERGAFLFSLTCRKIAQNPHT